MHPRLLASFLLVTACTAPILEPAPEYATCEFDDQAFYLGQRDTLLEMGRVVGGAFVPLAEGDEVEIAPWPEDTIGQWYGLVALRLTPTEDVGPSLCAQVSFSTEPLAGMKDVLMTRAEDGTYVAPRVPMPVGLRNNDNAAFFEELETPKDIEAYAHAPAPTHMMSAATYGTPAIKRVNHEGFLSTPRQGQQPDAGTPQYGLQVQVMPMALRPGETGLVEMRLEGQRAGGAVTLEVQGLPAGMTLELDRTVIPAEASDADAKLTSGYLLVGPAVAPGSYDLTVRARSGTYSVSELLQVMVSSPDNTRDVAVVVRPRTFSLAPGAEASGVVRLTPFGGFRGPVTLLADAPVDLDVSFEPPAVLLDGGPVDAVVRVKLLHADFPNDSTGFQLFAVSGREVFRPVAPGGAVISTAPSAPLPFVLPEVSERRVVVPGAMLDWEVKVGECRDVGQSPAMVTVTAPTPPPGCLVQPPSATVGFARVRVQCDGTAPAGGVPLSLVASSPAGSSSVSWRLVVAGSRPAGLESVGGVVPEVTPLALDAEAPQVASDAAGVVSVSLNGGLGLRFTSYTSGAGFSAFESDFGDRAALVSTPAGVVRVVRRDRQLLVTGKQPARTDDAIGPFDVAVDPVDGSLWVATGSLQPDARVWPWVGSASASVTTWTPRDSGLQSAGEPKELALAVRGGLAVLATTESNAVVVRRYQAGAWSAAPQVPAGLVPPAPFQGRGNERVLDLVLDAQSRPVLAFIGADEQLHLLRLEANDTWAALPGAQVTAGLLPLSLSLAVAGWGRAVLVWHVATHRLVQPSGRRVRPRHVETGRLQLARLEAAGFVALPRPGLDWEEGTPEQPFVAIDGAGRPLVTFVEDGRVVVQRGPP